MNRRERQREQITAAVQRGQYARVLVLSRQHLAEFGDDTDVRAAATLAARHVPEATTDEP